MLEQRLTTGQLEWVIALSTHTCFGKSVGLRVGAATPLRSNDTNTTGLEWPPGTLLIE